MNQRYVLFLRSKVYYCEDRQTGKQTSLRTRSRNEAMALLNAKNEAARQPILNFQMARVYLSACDPEVAARTWQTVMDEIMRTKTGANQARWMAAGRSRQFDALRSRTLIATQPEHLLHVLQEGTVSTNVFLRRMHNFALDMHWLPGPVIPKRQWPPVCYRERRAITQEEHTRIVERERNPSTRAFYQLLWHLGGSQSDIATLTAEDIDWNQHTIAYRRRKTGVTALISFGADTAAVLRQLPRSGQLFPALARIHERHRAKLFIKRLATVGISGVSLHSYRYAWAERAREAGYPERFAMQALGHSSKAVHRAYSKKALVTVPPLEDYEKGRVRKPATLLLQSDICRN